VQAGSWDPAACALAAANSAIDANIAASVFIRFESRGATERTSSSISGVAAPPTWSFAVVIGRLTRAEDPSAKGSFGSRF